MASRESLLYRSRIVAPNGIRARSVRATIVAAATCLCALVAFPALAAGQQASTPEGIHKIQHVVMIMQENRSFDSYFGTFPGADGIPAGVCVPDPRTGGCVAPFHDSSDNELRRPARTKRAKPTSTAARWTASSTRPRSGEVRRDRAGLQPCDARSERRNGAATT